MLPLLLSLCGLSRCHNQGFLLRTQHLKSCLRFSLWVQEKQSELPSIWLQITTSTDSSYGTFNHGPDYFFSTFYNHFLNIIFYAHTRCACVCLAQTFSGPNNISIFPGPIQRHISKIKQLPVAVTSTTTLPRHCKQKKYVNNPKVKTKLNNKYNKKCKGDNRVQDQWAPRLLTTSADRRAVSSQREPPFLSSSGVPSASLPPSLPRSLPLSLPRQIGSLARTTCDGDGRVTKDGGWLHPPLPNSLGKRVVVCFTLIVALDHPLPPPPAKTQESQHWSKTSCKLGWAPERGFFVVSVGFGGIL